jgi:hypothetical protein
VLLFRSSVSICGNPAWSLDSSTGSDHVCRAKSKSEATLDVRTDHSPLARPVLTYGLAAMDVATIHTVGPGDIIGEHGQHAVYVPRVEAIVDAFKDFDVIHHGLACKRICTSTCLGDQPCSDGGTIVLLHPKARRLRMSEQETELRHAVASAVTRDVTPLMRIP